MSIPPVVWSIDSPRFSKVPAALAALTARIKDAFDPKGVLNPGRKYEGL